MKKRRLLSILLTMIMIMSMLPAWTLTASAASGNITFTGGDSTNIVQTLKGITSSDDFTIGGPIILAVNDAGLTSVLGQTIIAGSEPGTDASPKTANISVANSVASVSVSDIEKSDSTATVNLYSDSTFLSEVTSGSSISLTAGDITTAYIKITAQGGTPILHYAVTINRAATVPSINLDPDYKINDAGYNWPDGNDTITMPADGDNLVLLSDTSPSDVIKIDITAPTGSNVTITGGGHTYTNLHIVVQNNITVNIENLNITAPQDKNALQFNNVSSTPGTATLNVTGTCTLTGNYRGAGISSSSDQDLTICGGGTLNVTGGNNDITDGGKGILTQSTPGGRAQLTIRDITVNAVGGSSSLHGGGSGIMLAWGDLTIENATVTAQSGSATSGVAGHGIHVSRSSAPYAGGSLTILNSTVTATGTNGVGIPGGFGLYSDSSMSITDSTIHAVSGTSDSKNGGSGIFVTANGLSITNSDVTVEGGASTTGTGGSGIYVRGGDFVISGGSVDVTGGNSGNNAGYAIYVNTDTFTIKDNADLIAVGGSGTAGVGGVGLRVAKYESPNLYGNTVTIANNAGDVYIRGGQGASEQRTAVMGKDVYIGTGNIDSVKMEGSNPRSIKNVVGGDDVYLVNVITSPAERVEIKCVVNGILGGTYTYSSVADANGKAYLWLPVNVQMLTSTGYTNTSLNVVADDTANSATLSKEAIVTAHNSSELSTYIESSSVTTINLVSGTTYVYDGTTIARALTINGNGATINVGTGISDTIVKKEGNTVTGPVFIAIDGVGSSLSMNNVTLHDVSTRILSVINVKTGGTLLLDGVTFEGFFANKEDDPAPTGSNMDGSHNNFGVHAEPGAVLTTVKNCTFGASNSFRNTVAIRNGAAIIQNNTFVGTATPARQNQTDGFEYAIFLYGGNCTVIGNDISGYDSILKPNGYHSAAISTCPYYDLTATINGNNLHNNARGIDGVGSWHTYSEPARTQINGTALDSSTNAFTIGQSLKAANTFSGNADGNISLSMDQNDYYVDMTSHVEYGPPAYYDTFLHLISTSSTGAVLSFDTGEWAQAIVRNAKAGSFKIEVSQDNGATWTTASTTDPLTNSSTGATVNLIAGKTYLMRAELTITANTRPVDSIDDVSADIICYSNTISATITQGDSGSSGGTASNGQSGASVIVNGESKTAGTMQTSKSTDGKTTATVTVDSAKLESILASEESGAMVVIPITGKFDTAAGILTGEMVKSMERRDATLVVRTDLATYTLPASEINITAISQQLGTNVNLRDITVAVSIAETSGQMTSIVENAAKDGGFTLMLPSMDYTVTCSYGGRTVSVSSFNSYIERTIAIPDGVNPSKITTGIVVNPDGTIHHVPTRITVVDGKYYAVINSLTNSTYSVVWNPIEFSDVNNHWSKASINNMGSRMVVSGVGNGNYEPNRNMTRAEFAAVIVRALGLAPEKGESSFGDVASDEWYCGYVKTASSYGIIEGYSDIKFGPNDVITREQAMTMIARAMKITGLDAELTNGEIGELMETYSDRVTVSGYAKNSIAECIKAGVVFGRENNTLAPKSYVTRAEVAAMVERLLKKSNLI